jgi:hypothetical protein
MGREPGWTERNRWTQWGSNMDSDAQCDGGKGQSYDEGTGATGMIAGVCDEER